MSFSVTSIWAESSWKQDKKKYCKICDRYIREGTRVRFGYDSEYHGLCHEKCVDKIEKNREKEAELESDAELSEAKASIGEPIKRGDLISPQYIAKDLGVSLETVRSYLANRGHNERTKKNILDRVANYTKLDYGQGVHYSWPGRFIYKLAEILRNDKFLHDIWLRKDHFDIWGYGLERKIAIANDDRVILYREPADYQRINYRASFLAKRKVMGDVLICTLKDWAQLQETGRLAREMPPPRSKRIKIPPQPKRVIIETLPKIKRKKISHNFHSVNPSEIVFKPLKGVHILKRPGGF